jgi:hypothetical protein
MANNGAVEPEMSDLNKFLLNEYNGLLELDKARNERFDRLVTMFLSLAGAPWILYALVIKDKGNFSFGEMPPLIAWAFLLVGLLGLLVVIMCIQTKFLITLYMRALNAIRGHFAQLEASNALRLPTVGTVPPYYERGSYNFYAALGMALVNASYVSLAFYRLLSPWQAWKWTGFLAGLVWVVIHYQYYVRQARGRQTRDSAAGLEFRPSAASQNRP